jgi:beta-galactosidase
MYMFHGGSTRGFMNGANYKGNTPYEPQISSYDYDAPLDEAGNPTPKFWAFRKVIEKHLPAGQQLPDVPAAKTAISIPVIKLTQQIPLNEMLSKGVSNATPLTFEDLNQDYGFVWYRATVQGGKTGVLKLKDLRDYAIIMVNGHREAVLDRRLNQDSIRLDLPAGNVKLDILVENLGRINFGKYLLQNKKGITEKVTWDGAEVRNWQMFSLPFDNVNHINYTNKATASTPVVKKGNFNLTTVGDTYLDMSEWGKGVVWINGHNLGRYWSVGPQQTLYVPVEWLKKGDNEIVVLELLKPGQTHLAAIDKPILNKLQ